MLKAILFDCDGVIADSEGLHLSLFQQLLEELGVRLTKEQYYASYLAMDDKACFRTALKDNGKPVSEEQIQELVGRKTALYKQAASRNLVIFPGVVEFVMAAAQKYPLAVASGALKEEVLLMVDTAGLRQYFDVFVAAEDVTRGKPAPDAYLKAMELLNRACPGKDIRPADCLVVEDSKHGIASAHAAGMKCLAVCTSYPVEALSAADKIVPYLTAAKLSDLEALFRA